MNKEEILQLRKEVVILSDYPEVYENDTLQNNLESMKDSIEKVYDGLTIEDKRWLDSNFNKWLEFYVGNLCSGECGCCSCDSCE